MTWHGRFSRTDIGEFHYIREKHISHTNSKYLTTLNLNFNDVNILNFS
jgi:hypothetical protein